MKRKCIYHNFQILFYLLLISFFSFETFSSAQQSTQKKIYKISSKKKFLCSNENLNSVLWMQTSSEYKALTLQAYSWATKMLDKALIDKKWSALPEQIGKANDLPPAVILDIDETVLDNSPFQARMVKKNYSYSSKMWREWVKETSCQPIPGALAFTKYASSKGVTVFFVSNRSHPLEKATRANLSKLSFPLSNRIDTILTKYEKKKWSSDKGSRRQFVASRYRVLLLIGDNLGDFLSHVKVSLSDRYAMLKKFSNYWGEKWIVIPNPAYGSWVGALYNYDYSLSDSEKKQKKLDVLQTK